MSVFLTLIVLNGLVAACIAILLFLRRIAYAVRPEERHNGLPRPPIVPSWIPFLGHALNMTKGEEFWTRIERKYGPAVRLVVMGQTKIFVTSTELINYVYRDSKAFDFSTVRCDMSTSVFDMTYPVSHAPIWRDRLFDAHHRNMQPGVIAESIKRYTRLLETTLTERLHSLEKGVVVDLVDWVYDVIYTASSKALMGPTFPASSTKAPFIAFDRAFPILSLDTLPSLAYKSAYRTRSQIIDIIESWWKYTTPEDRAAMASHIAIELEAKESEGWSDRDWATILLSELWALEANAPYAGIWTVVEILRRPEILVDLRVEVSDTIQSLSPPTLSSLLELSQPELVQRLPKVNAAFQETLRFHTSSFSIRVVQKDTAIPSHLTASPHGLSLVQGDQIICITNKNQVSIDGDWGVTAGRWDHNRWTDGKKGTMMPFGGGVSMCEGRHFASAEILTFIATYLYMVDTEVVKDTLQENMQRVGLGMMHPKGEMRVRLSARG